MMRPYSFTPDVEYFFCTDTIVGWHYVFVLPEFFEIIVESFKFCRREEGLRIHGYVIMPNHVHSILSSVKGDLSDIVRDYKRHTSREISGLLEQRCNYRSLRFFSTAAEFAGRGNDYRIWQSGSHPEAVFTESFFQEKLNYIHMNPVRKGFVGRPEDWLYSSARNYVTGDDSVMEIDRCE